MRGLTRRWLGPDGIAPSERSTAAGGSVGAGSLLERIVHVRKLAGDARAQQILRAPSWSQLHKPALLPGADAVAERLERALRARKHIAIYGDYDADGITSMAVLWHVLRAADPECTLELVTPRRFEDGYGLNSEVLRDLQARGVQTVVTVDCGITAVEPARVARELGMELLITDHHSPEPSADGTFALPDADAIAHPALPGREQAPFTELCGAAVAFKVASRFAVHWCGGERVAQVLQDALKHVIPLVALGTVADVVPLIDENRIFVATGLASMQRSTIPGLRALLDDAQLTHGLAVESEHVAFRIAPRLNAIGRLGDAAEAVELLTTADATRARAIAAKLAQCNEERKRIEQAIFTQACALVEAKGLHKPDVRAIALTHEAWHEGVVGIVCTKVAERYGRPTVLLCMRPDGTAKGSGRSLDGFDLVSAVRSCAQHLENCGGHAAAAGLTVKAGAWDAFARDFTARCNGAMVEDDVVPTTRYDIEADIDELTKEAIGGLDVLRPFGRANREPAVLVRGLRIQSSPSLLGQTRAHLEFHVKAPRNPVRCIWWNGAQHARAFAGATSMDAIIRPKLDAWRGAMQLQFEVVDVALTATAALPRQPRAHG